jgi:RimJ/RimL family protein N-acetyltransferase
MKQASASVALEALNGTALAPPPDMRPAWLNYKVLVAGEPVGTCGLLFREDGGVEIGYRIAPEHRRRGYASAALARLIGRAFEDLGVGAVEAEVAQDNVPSRALLGRLGFIDTGGRRERWSARRQAYIDYVLYRIVRS